MPVSFDPDWQTASQNSGSSLAVALPSGGSVQVAMLIVGNDRTLTDTSGFEVPTGGLFGNGDGVRQYLMHRPASAAPISFSFSGSAMACVVVGAYPSGTYGFLEVQPVANQPTNPIVEFLDTGGLPVVAGMFFSSTNAVGNPAPTPLTLDVASGAVDVSAQVDGSTTGVKMALVAFALEPVDNPTEIHINPAAPAEDRFVSTLGAIRSGWTLGRVGWRG